MAMAGTEQPVGEQRTDRKGKKKKRLVLCLRSSLLCQNCTLESTLNNNPAFSSAFHRGSLRSLHSGVFKHRVKEWSECTLQRDSLRVGSFLFPLGSESLFTARSPAAGKRL